MSEFATLSVVVPVMKNFEGFTRLMESIKYPMFLKVIPNYDDNIGVSRSWNNGLGESVWEDYTLIVNDDVIFEPGSVVKMINELESDLTIDLVTAVNTRDWPVEGSGNPDEPDYSAFMVRSKMFPRKFGWFDENFYPAYFEDNDMSYRIRLGGGKEKKLLTARMYHAGSVTQNWNGEQVVDHAAFVLNRDYYVSKWGGTPGEEKYTAPFNGAGGLTYKDW
jgi:GT2 family glycosyltransferase